MGKENARRYFEAVQGHGDHKGELFGIKNLFRMQVNGTSLTQKILEVRLPAGSCFSLISQWLKEQEVNNASKKKAIGLQTCDNTLNYLFLLVARGTSGGGSRDCCGAQKWRGDGGNWSSCCESRRRSQRPLTLRSSATHLSHPSICLPSQAAHSPPIIPTWKRRYLKMGSLLFPSALPYNLN